MKTSWVGLESCIAISLFKVVSKPTIVEMNFHLEGGLASAMSCNICTFPYGQLDTIKHEAKP